MNTFKRYCSAFKRYTRSKGHGIHSPFAFNFVLKVLRERAQYYAYDYIDTCRWEAICLASSKDKKCIISSKDARMIFRIACYFSPNEILEIGSSYGITSTTLLHVSSTINLHLYPGAKHNVNIFDVTTKDFNQRIVKYDDINNAIDSFHSLTNNCPFIVVNDIDPSIRTSTYNAIATVLQNGGVAIFTQLNHCKIMKQCWDEIRSSMQHGMSFTNEKMGIIVAKQHLPLQHFSLWF